MNWKLKHLRLDDEALVKQCQRGDLEAMSCLILRYQDRLYNTILKICNNSDDAAELTQDTFVKVIENIGSFRQKSSFYTWLFRVGVNEAINFCRRRFNAPLLTLETAAAAAALTDKADNDPAALAQQKEIITLMTEAIGRLDESVALGGVKPLDDTFLSHYWYSSNGRSVGKSGEVGLIATTATLSQEPDWDGKRKAGEARRDEVERQSLPVDSLGRDRKPYGSGLT